MKIILLSSLLLTTPVFSGEVSTILKYYYIPFQIETYLAVTPQNIRKMAIYKGDLSEEDSSKIIRLITNKKQSKEFDGNRVRLLVETQAGKNFIFVDAKINVLNGRDEYSLNPQAGEALKKMLAVTIRVAKKDTKHSKLGAK